MRFNPHAPVIDLETGDPVVDNRVPTAAEKVVIKQYHLDLAAFRKAMAERATDPSKALPPDPGPPPDNPTVTVTMGILAMRALHAVHEADKELPAEEVYKRFELALRITKCKPAGTIELSDEEATILKDLVARNRAWGVANWGQMWMALGGAPDTPISKPTSAAKPAPAAGKGPRPGPPPATSH